MNFLRWSHILCALALAINLLPAKAAQIAYSVADFSSVQGQKNWYYGYFEKGLPSGPGYTPDDFELLDRYVPNVDPNLTRWPLTPPPGEGYGGYPWIRPTGSHPAGMGPVPQQEIIWSVLRYRSPVSGLITIAYDLGKGNTSVPRGGVTGRIFVDGRQTFTRFIANLNSIGVRGSITANVKGGSFIDFAVDSLGIKPLVGADSIYSARADGTRFTGRISTNTNLRATAMSAQSDLDEAWEIAERGPMPLFLADIHLHRARLFGRMKDEGGNMKYPWESPHKDLAEARRLIEKHGYGRRMEELEDAENAIVRKPSN